LIVGKIAGPSGLRGAVKVDVMTDFPERFSALDTVYLGDEMAPYRLRGAEVRKGGRQVVLRFHGCDTREQADDLRGRLIWIPIEEAMPLEEGLYYVHQVLGLKVQTEAGEPLGTLNEVLVTGSNDVYVVNDGEREVLIPVLQDVIREVDLAGRRMIVRLPEGLLG
jgi:16S rRNA processing protein RimM